MSSNTFSSASQIGLSPLAGGSRQFIITLEEGVYTEVPSSMLCDVSARTDMGVATALTLIAFDQVPAVKNISFIRTGDGSTGNAAAIAIGANPLDSYLGNDRSYSSGTSTILVANSTSNEKITLTYDTASLGAGSLSSPRGIYGVSYASSADEATLGQGANWTSSNTASDIVVAQVASDGIQQLRLCVRKNSALYETILANYVETADEDCMRLLLAQNQTVNVKFASESYPTPYDFVPGSVANSGIWTAFRTFELTPLAADVILMFFATATPAVGQISGARMYSIRHESTKRRCVKCTFNAVAISSGSLSRYGGGIASR